MKSVKKLLIAAGLFSSFAAFGSLNASALTITDVPSNYWAGREIVESIQQNYIQAKGTKFMPEDSITRADFANAVYEVIQRNVAHPEVKFKDVKSTSPYSDSILTLKQLQILFGYPDGTFRPDSPIKRSEASSVIANLVRTHLWDLSVLDNFEDRKSIPAWAKPSYINNIINDVYVNYPNSNKLTPNDSLTRAQAAVLLVKVQNAIENYKVSYMPSANKGKDGDSSIVDISDTKYSKKRRTPVFIGTNTLDEFKYPYKNNVDIYDIKKVVEAGNIVPLKALQKSNSRTLKEGEELTYVSPKDIYSKEGTKLYPQGTKFVAYVEETQNSYWLKKQDKAYIVFNKAILPNGQEFPVAGVLYTTYKGKIIYANKKSDKRLEKDVNLQFAEKDKAIKFTNKLIPVLKYKEDAKDSLYMLVTGDMIIPETSTL